jgi:hypothetical protein
MIFESSYWKDELLKLSQRLSARRTFKRRWTEDQHGSFEKEIMIGFYIIRKLIEAQKLSNINVSTKVSGFRIPHNAGIVHRMNSHRYYEFYDFGKTESSKFDLIFLCNQIVHSYVFAPAFIEENGKVILESIHFCSDDKRNSWLFELTVDTLIDLLNKLGEDFPSDSRMHYDEKKKDYTITNGNEEVIQKHMQYLKSKLKPKDK